MPLLLLNPASTIPQITSTTSRPNARRTSKTTLPIWVSNLRSVKNNLPDFRVLIQSQPDTIFAACETWFDCSVYDSQLVDLAHLEIFRKDRNKSGGGVLLAVPSHIKCTRRLNLEQHGLQAVFVISTEKAIYYTCVLSTAHLATK